MSDFRVNPAIVSQCLILKWDVSCAAFERDFLKVFTVQCWSFWCVLLSVNLITELQWKTISHAVRFLRQNFLILKATDLVWTLYRTLLHLNLTHTPVQAKIFLLSTFFPKPNPLLDQKMISCTFSPQSLIITSVKGKIWKCFQCVNVLQKKG